MLEVIIGPVVGAIVGGFITWGIGYSVAKSDLGKLNASKMRVSQLERKVQALQRFEQKYRNVRERLSASSVVEDYFQPVILVGPIDVGKTSLVRQWDAPWDHKKTKSTDGHKISIVPVLDHEQTDTKPHFADPDIRTKVKAHLKLRVHDFPGELGEQKNIRQQVIHEIEHLRENQKKNLGIVLICMFDASEVAPGLTEKTHSYYNGELFANLRTMVAHRNVGIQRLILVFNKFDLLRQKYPNLNDTDLLKRCAETFAPILSPLHGICNPERVCEVFSVLDREEKIHNSQGASIVLGEAARGLVEAIRGSAVVHETTPNDATKFSATYF